MIDPIPSLLLLLQEYSWLLPFSTLRVQYKGEYFPIVLPREEFFDSFSFAMMDAQRHEELPRAAIMGNVLRKLAREEWALFQGQQHEDDFVQYTCHWVHQLPLFPTQLWFLMSLSFHIPFLRTPCYYLDFPQKNTAEGRKRIRRAISIARRFGCVSEPEFETEYLHTKAYPNHYVILKHDPKWRYFKVHCGNNYFFAAAIGHAILSEVLCNQDPLLIRMGKYE